MDEECSDQVVQASRKRVRRNALKPNSAETDALREFSLVHTFCEKSSIDTMTEESLESEDKPSKLCRLDGDGAASVDTSAADVTGEIEELTSLPVPPPSNPLLASSSPAPCTETEQKTAHIAEQ
jgi:hypothetical protein